MTKVRIFTALIVFLAMAAIAIWLVRSSANGALSSFSLGGQEGEITALAFAPDGLTLAFGSAKGADVRVWDVRRRSEKYILKTPGVVSHLLFTHDSELVAWDLTWEENVRVWDAGGRLSFVLRPSSKPLSEIVYCPESQTFAVAFEDKSHKSSMIYLENAYKGSSFFNIDVVGSLFTPMVTTPDGRYLAVGTMVPVASDSAFLGEEVYVLDLKAGELRSQFRITRSPERLELSPDGRFLAAWWMNEAMNIEIWNVETGKLITTLHANVKATLSDVRFSPDGKTLAAAAGDRTSSIVPFFRGFDRVYGEVRLWELATARNVETIETGCPVTRIAFSTHTRSLAVGCDDGTVKVWQNGFTK